MLQDKFKSIAIDESKRYITEEIRTTNILDIELKVQTKDVSKIQENCTPLLINNLSRSEFTKSDIHGHYLNIKNLDKPEYKACVSNEINNMVLDIDNLQRMVVSSDITVYKFYPEFRKALDEIKSDNKITVGELIHLNKVALDLKNQVVIDSLSLL